MKSIKKINTLIRLSDWWNYIFPPILALAYLQIFIYGLLPEKIYADLLLFFISFVGTASFGFILNDISDTKEDLHAGKKNHVSNLSVPKRFLVLFLSLNISVVPWFFISYNHAVIGLFILQLILLAIYSIPPVRLKRFKYAGILTDGFYSSVIPAFIALFLFAYEGNYHWALLSVVFLCMIFKGVRNIISHQIEDFNNDMRINAKTFAVSAGIKQSQYIIGRIIIPLEIISALAFFVLILSFNDMRWPFLALFAFMFIVYFFSIKRTSGKSNFIHNFLNDLYGDLLPIFILILLCFTSKYYLIILFLHFFIFRKKPLYLYINFLIIHILYHRIIVWLYFKLFCNQYVRHLFKKKGNE